MATLNITVRDQDSAAIEGARVTVFKEDNLTIVASGLTSVAGLFTCTPVTGRYKVEVSYRGATFLPSTDVVVSTDPTNVIISGTTVAVSDMSTPPRCRVFGYVLTPIGEPAAGVRVSVDIVGRGAWEPFVNASGTGVDDVNTAVTGRHDVMTDKVGFWSVDLVQKSIVRISIEALRFVRVFEVPELSLLNIKDARPRSGQDDQGVMGNTPARNR